MRRWSLMAALLIGTSARAELGELTVAIHHMQLPSGLKVIHRRDTRFPVVHGAVGINAGSAGAPEGISQVAHLTEHLWFRSDMGEGELWDVIDAQACNRNAYTSLHHTVFWNTCPSVVASDMVERLATLLQGELSSLQPEHIAQEQRIIEREQRLRDDSAAGRVYDQNSEYLWPKGHPLHRTHAEQQASGIDRITLDDVDAWLAAEYRPENAVLALSGDLTRKDVFELLRDHLPPRFIHPDLTREHLKTFRKVDVAYANYDACEDLGDDEECLADDLQEVVWYEDPHNPGQPLARPAWPTQDLMRDARPLPVPPQEGRPVIPVADEHDSLMIGWTLPPAHRSNYWPLKRVAYYANIALWTAFRNDDDVISFGCQTDEGAEGSALLCTLELADDAKVDKIDDRVRGMFGTRDFTTTQSEWLSSAWKGGSRFNMWALDLADADELSAAIEYILTTGSSAYQSSKGLTGASSGVPRMKSYITHHMTEARAVSLLLEARETSLAADGQDGRIASSKVAPTSPLPSIEGQDTFSFFADAESTRMAGDLRLLTLPLDGPHRGSYSLVFPRDDDGYHGALDTMIFWAHLDPDKKDMKDYVTVYQDTWWGYRITEYTGQWVPMRLTDSHITMSSMWIGGGRTSEFVARFFMPYLLHPTLKPMTKKEKKRWDDRLVRSWRGKGYWTSQWAWQKLSGETRAMGITPEDVQAVLELDPEVIEARWETLLNPARATLVAVGEVNDDELQTAVKEWMWEFTALDRPEITDVPFPAPPETWGTGRHLALVPEEGATSNVSVSLTCPLADSLSKSSQNTFAHNYLAESVRNAMFDQIRQEKGLAYTPGAFSWRLEGRAILNLRAVVAPEDALETLEIFQDILSGAREPVSPVLLEAGRRRHFHAQQTYMSSMLASESMAQQGAAKGLDLQRLARPASELMEVTSAHLQAAIAPCQGHEVITLSGARTQLDALQAELGMEADVIDWKEDFLQRIETHYPKRLAKERKRLER